MTEGTVVTKYKGIQIFVSQYGTFNAEVNGKEIIDKTLQDLEEKLDKQIKTDLTFKPIDAIEANENRKVRITSLDRSGSRSYIVYVWVSYSDERGDHRGKESLDSGWVDRPSKYYKVTPKNLEVLAEIEQQNAQVVAIRHKIEELRKNYTDPITKKDVGAKDEQDD